MRAFLIAVFIALLSVQAYAQTGKGHSSEPPSNAPKEAEQKRRLAKEEAAAKAAMQQVPDSKEKYDPWKIGK